MVANHRRDITIYFEDGKESEIKDTAASPFFVVPRVETMSGKKAKKVEVSQKVPAIENGIVIDHIPKGRGKEILELLENEIIPKESYIAICYLTNVESEKIGRKDLIKIYDYEIDERYIEKIYSLFKPEDRPTISYIKDWEVYKKIKPNYGVL